MKLEKKYGLFTAIGMVVGIVIGSGVFFKAQDILNKTNGNLTTGILAWIIGGIIMLLCSCTFAVMATKYEKVNGIVDYSEVTVGKKYGYFVGWFLATIYYPTLTSVLAWLSARYFGELFGWAPFSAQVMTLGCIFMIGSYTLNALSPKLAGKFQVSTTVIKLIPLLLMAVVGIVYGLIKNISDYKVIEVLQDGELVKTVVKDGSSQLQILIDNFKNSSSGSFKTLLAAVVATSFAYEGWIIATSINAELKNSKKNLPFALLIGAFIVIAVYIIYYIGVAGGATVSVLQTGGARYAFLQVFGDFFGTVLTVFIVISCMGTLNGLMLANTRGLYALANRQLGPNPKVFEQIDEKTNMPTNSSIIGLLFCAAWYVYFYGANHNWFGKFSFDSSELPIVTIYAMYIPIFVILIIKERHNFGTFKGVILPIFGIIACCFMVFAAFYAHLEAILYYLIIYVVIMLIGYLFLFKNGKPVVAE